MKILFIGPLPDPVTGHSLACKTFLDELKKNHEVDVINLSKENLKTGLAALSFPRIRAVLGVIWNVWRKKSGAEIIYFTISESFAGNIKDLLIYLVCFRSLSRMLIHLHGGSLKKLIFDKSRLLFRINQFFISRLGGVIVLGPAHLNIFSGLISEKKIHTVPNFFEDDLLTTETEIANKFRNTHPLRILFLSNFIQGKGFDEMIDAYLNSTEHLQEGVRIDFAGAFESDTHKAKFIKRIDRLPQIQYHGLVENSKKKELFSRAHLFCLPTSLHEGQPISILEAYASGCVVITTNQGGIPDLFRDQVNGFKVEAKSTDSLSRVFEQCLQNPDRLMPIAVENFKMAREKYRSSSYNSSLINIVNSLAKSSQSLSQF